MSDEGKKYIPEGAFLVCDQGGAVSQLIATPRNISLYSPNIATEEDNKFTLNILPFGTCKKKGNCVFTCVDWTKVKSGPVFINGKKPLLEDSEALCKEGQGKITIFFDQYEAELANENNNESSFVKEDISSNILGTVLGGPALAIGGLFSDDIKDFTEGIGRGFKKGMEGTYNFITDDMWKADTWKGMGKMVLIGSAYFGPLGPLAGDTYLKAYDDILGTDLQGTRDSLVEGVSHAGSNAWEDVKRGNWGEVGESGGQIAYAVVEAVAGSKGAGLVAKGLTSSAKALIGAERLAAVSAKVLEFTNALKSGILGVVRVGRKPKVVTNLLEELLKLKKPKNLPDLKKWTKNGGKVEYLDDGTWRFTDWDGNVVNYRNGYPDFSNYSRQNVDIGSQQGNYTTDYANAVSRSRKKPPKLDNKDTVWHHHEDGKTMMEVDRKIHDRFTHRGGVSNSNKAKLGKK